MGDSWFIRPMKWTEKGDVICDYTISYINKKNYKFDKCFGQIEKNNSQKVEVGLTKL